MTSDDTAKIKQHLDACGPCLKEYDLDQALKALVKRSCACEEAPVELRTQIMARITTIQLQADGLSDGTARVAADDTQGRGPISDRSPPLVVRRARAQALGLRPWLAALPLRERRLRARLLMGVTPSVGVSSGPAGSVPRHSRTAGCEGQQECCQGPRHAGLGVPRSSKPICKIPQIKNLPKFIHCRSGSPSWGCCWMAPLTTRSLTTPLAAAADPEAKKETCHEGDHHHMPAPSPPSCPLARVPRAGAGAADPAVRVRLRRLDFLS